MILPAMGIAAEIIANNIRKPLWGYKSMVYSVIFPVYVVYRLGASYVSNGHGDGHQRVLPDDDDDHLDPFSYYSDLSFPLALGRVDPF